jgi:hypothetical protein
MQDPLEGAIALILFNLALVFFLWTAFDARSVIELLFPRVKTMPGNVIFSLSMLGVFSVCGLFVILIGQVMRWR